MAFDFGKVVAVFENKRIPESERKPELYYYELRKTNGSFLVRDRVAMNCWGTLVTKKPVAFMPGFGLHPSCCLSKEESSELVRMSFKNV